MRDVLPHPLVGAIAEGRGERENPLFPLQGGPGRSVKSGIQPPRPGRTDEGGGEGEPTLLDRPPCASNAGKPLDQRRWSRRDRAIAFPNPANPDPLVEKGDRLRPSVVVAISLFPGWPRFPGGPHFGSRNTHAG